MKEYEEDDFELYEEDDDEVLGVDEEIKRNHNEDSEFLDISEEDEELLESDDEIELEEKEEDSVKVTESSLLKTLRNELEKPEYRRNYFRFKYRGEKYTGIPLYEINPGKYVMLVDDKMKGFYLNEMEIL